MPKLFNEETQRDNHCNWQFLIAGALVAPAPAPTPIPQAPVSTPAAVPAAVPAPNPAAPTPVPQPAASISIVPTPGPSPSSAYLSVRPSALPVPSHKAACWLGAQGHALNNALGIIAPLHCTSDGCTAMHQFGLVSGTFSQGPGFASLLCCCSGRSRVLLMHALPWASCQGHSVALRCQRCDLPAGPCSVAEASQAGGSFTTSPSFHAAMYFSLSTRLCPAVQI